MLARESRGVENFFGARGIVRILRDIPFGRPVIRGQHASGQLCLPMEEVANERLAVRRESKRLPNFAMRQKSILEVATQVVEIRPAAVANLKLRLARENRNNVRRKGTHFQRRSFCEVRARERRRPEQREIARD